MILVDSVLILIVVAILTAIVWNVSSTTKSSKEITESNDLTEIPQYRGEDDRPNKLFEKA